MSTLRVQTQTMRARRYEDPPDRETEIIAIFGAARLVRHLNGRLELSGGSPEDRERARTWAVTFLRQADGSGSEQLRRL